MSEPSLDLAYYRARIAALADKEIFAGTSSWTYEGWLGQIYTPERSLQTSVSLPRTT